MSDQNPPTDTSADDAEGHSQIRREAPRARTVDDATEGRGRRRGAAEDLDDDTEGHQYRRGGTDKGDDDDDTEGHQYRR